MVGQNHDMTFEYVVILSRDRDEIDHVSLTHRVLVYAFGTLGFVLSKQVPVACTVCILLLESVQNVGANGCVYLQFLE